MQWYYIVKEHSYTVVEEVLRSLSKSTSTTT